MCMLCPPKQRTEMHDFYFWTAFFGAPLFLLLVTAFVFRPSAREGYRAAKQVIFTDEHMQGRNPRPGPDAR